MWSLCKNEGGSTMVAVGIVSFILGGFVGTLIMALCVAASNEEEKRERDEKNVFK